MEKDRSELFQELFDDETQFKRPFIVVVFESREEKEKFYQDRLKLNNGYGMGQSDLPIDNVLRLTPSTVSLTWRQYSYRPVTDEEKRRAIMKANQRVPWDWHSKYFETPYR